MALMDPLLPRREQQILAALVLHPEGSFSVSDLIRIGGKSRAGGQAIVNRYVEGGLAVDERVGNQRRIRLNTQWPLLEEVRSICVKSFGVAEPIKAALGSIADKLDFAFLFGSIVKRTDSHASDIDVLLVGDAGLAEILSALRPLEQRLGRPIQINAYSGEEWRHLQSDGVIQSILGGPIVMLLGQIHA